MKIHFQIVSAFGYKLQKNTNRIFCTEQIIFLQEYLRTLTNLQILSNFPKKHELFLDQTLIWSTSARNCIYFSIYKFGVAFNLSIYIVCIF